MLRRIRFFNFFHNGDVFTGKAFVQSIMREYPGFDYSYALGCSAEACEIPRFKAAAGTSPETIKDLRCETLPCDALLEDVGWFDKVVLLGDQVFVNTWVGAYAEQVFLPGEEHANYASLQKMWAIIFNELNAIMNINLQPLRGLRSAVATTDWSVYNRHAAESFIAADVGSKRLLFSNGPVASEQSVWGESDMRDVIQVLAASHPAWTVICTRKFDTESPNVFFTDDVFPDQRCDINEIAFLSTHCNFIWGKVSGPYMYCHVRDNIFDTGKIFFSSSDRPSDSLTYGSDGLKCHYYHSLSGDSATLIGQVEMAVAEAEHHVSPGVMTILT